MASEALSVQNELKTSNTLLHLLWHIAVKYVIKGTRKLETEWACHFLFCAKYCNFIGQDFKTMKKKSGTSVRWECRGWSGSKQKESLLIYKTVILCINLKYVQSFASYIVD
jgi:hypothetical protein